MAEDPVRGVRRPAAQALREGATLIFSVLLLSTENTAPRRGVSSRTLLTLRRGVCVAQTQNIPVRTSAGEGAGMS